MRDWAIWLGLALAGITAFGLSQSGYGGDIAVVGFLAVLCVIWWVFEPIPIPVTSLLPMAVLPLLGVLTPAQVGQAYGSPLILLLLGGHPSAPSPATTKTHRVTTGSGENHRPGQPGPA